MDAEKLVQAFTPEEAQEVADALPADVLRYAVVRRGLEVPAMVGPVALLADAIELAEARAVLNEDQTEISQFLDPEAEMSAESQLEFMTEFWGKLGHNVPSLSEDQKAKLAKTVAAHPGKRIIPTPLSDVDWRKDIAQRAKENFPGNQFSDDKDPLLTSNVEGPYGSLLGDPESTVEYEGTSYGLGYKTPYNVVVLGQKTFKAALLESGQAVEAKNLDFWVFPVMDVAVESDRAYAPAGDLYLEVGTSEVPEALITVQLLHQANGTPNSEWHVDLANEVVCELNDEGEPIAIARVAGVHWDPGQHQVNLISWPADSYDDKFGVRGVVH